MSLKNVILELLMMRDAIQPLGAINTDFGSNFTLKLIAPKNTDFRIDFKITVLGPSKSLIICS